MTAVTNPDEAQTEILGEIDETRREMAGTLNELGDRLAPGHLVDQAKENVREATIGRLEDTARGMSDMVFETIKRNPIPTAMAGVGLAMLWRNRSQETQRQPLQRGPASGACRQRRTSMPRSRTWARR